MSIVVTQFNEEKFTLRLKDERWRIPVSELASILLYFGTAQYSLDVKEKGFVDLNLNNICVEINRPIISGEALADDINRMWVEQTTKYFSHLLTWKAKYVLSKSGHVLPRQLQPACCEDC